MTAMSRGRIDALDGLRGFAALTVVFHHCLLAVPAFEAAYEQEGAPTTPLAYWLAHTPARVFWNGHAAVLLFFVLSGFVLALPFLQARPTYGSFVVRRVCRIYFPYLITIAASALLMIAVPHSNVPSLSVWFNAMWDHPPSPKEAVALLSMTNQMTHDVDTSAWSLYHEMRISLAFPVLMLLVMRSRAILLLLGAGTLMVVGMVALPSARVTNWQLTDTVHYAACFVLGACIARWRVPLEVWFHERRRSVILMLTLVALIIFNTDAFVGLTDAISSSPRAILLDDLGATLGGSIAILLALTSRPWQRLLCHRWSIWIGRISYSLYLVHPVVLLVLIHLSAGLVPFWVPLLLTPPASLLLGAVMNRYVEMPSTALGKSLSNRFDEMKLWAAVRRRASAAVAAAR